MGVSLVQVQTLRGNAGVQAATTVVQNAVNAYNATNKASHVVHTFSALAPNTKGMQVQLCLLAALARKNGCTLIRLSVHNGNVALCGTQAAINATLAAAVPTYNAMQTLATNTYVPATHGARMGFINAFMCGLCASLQNGAPATVLAYGIGHLFTMPAPGSGTAYALGANATLAPATTAPATPRVSKAPAKAPAKVA